MNKLTLFLCAVFAFFACNKINNKTDLGLPLKDIEFDVTINFPKETNEIKTNWEIGDAVFLIIAYHSDFYIKMTYDGSDWNTTLCGDGALSATIPNSQRTVTAIYMPLGSNDTPYFRPINQVGPEMEWVFPTTYFTSFLYCQQAPYTLHQEGTKWEFSATLDMKNEIYSFWAEDSDSASGSDYMLYTDGLVAQGFDCVYFDGRVFCTDEWDILNGDKRMPGYEYKGGWLFSGGVYGSAVRSDLDGCYLILTDSKGDNRHDYPVIVNIDHLQPFMKLPPIGSSEWVAVGKNKYVELITEDNMSLGSWSTCNVGATVPEEIGTGFSFNDAVILGAPSKNEINELLDNCTLAWISVNEQMGMVAKAAKGFLFFPAKNQTSESYWTSTLGDEAYHDIGYIYNFTTPLTYGYPVEWQFSSNVFSQKRPVRTVKK